MTRRGPLPVVVGVVHGQPDHVLECAALFAVNFGAELICAHVNAARFAVAEDADGNVTTRSIDPDYADEREHGFDAELAAHLSAVLAASGVEWSTRALAGETAAALGRLADTVDAAMIIVGSHHHSLAGGVREFAHRSVAVHLAHSQTRPVVLVPSRAPSAR